MKHFALLTLAALLVLPPALSASVFEARPFEDPALEERYRALIAELRCLQCQNQSLADSNAPLAGDLRREIRAMVEKGQRNEAIVEFLVARYGDFVLYRPPVQSNTVVLWLAPFLAGAAGLMFLVVLIRRRQRQAPETTLSAADHQRAIGILDNPEPRETD